MSKLSSYPLVTSIAQTDAVPITSGYGGTPSTDNAQISLLLADPGVQVWNVMAFGAKGDGSTNDATAIQSTITAAHNDGGGVVYFPPGTYMIGTALLLYSFITIRGAGRGLVTIKLNNAVNNNAFVANSPGGYESIVIEHVTVDGNASNQTGAGAGSALIYITGSDTLMKNIRVSNCTVQNSYKHGIFLTGDNTSTRYPKWITGNYIFNHGPTSIGFGIYTDYCPNTEIAWNTLKQSNGNDAIEMGHIGEQFCHNNYLVDGKIQFPFADNSVISNNILDADTIQNDANTANNVVIIGNKLKNITPASGFGGISVTGDQPTIVGNYVKVTAQAGIRVYGASTNAIISDNLIDGSNQITGGTNGIYPDHSSNVIMNGNLIQNFARGIQIVFDNNQITNNKFLSVTTGVYFSNSTSSGHVIVSAQVSNNDLGGATTPIDYQNQTNAFTIFNNELLNPQRLSAQGNVSAAATFSSSSGNTITATLTGNITVTLPSGGAKGDKLTLRLTQDGTGTRTATWPANFKKAGGTLTLTTTAGATDVISMTWDGTNWLETSRAMAVA